MKPRDISVTQLWVEDLNDSLSSLESFSSEEEARADESSDEEEEEEEVLVQQAKRDRRQSISSSRRRALPRVKSSKRQTPTSSGLPRRATFHDGCLQAQQTPTPTKQRTRRRRNSTFGSNSNTNRPSPQEPSPSLAVSSSPMRKFRMGSHISDSALSASRSCASQRRRVSQANAKWDASNNAFQSRRGASIRGRGSNVFLKPTLVQPHGNHNHNSSNHSPSPYHDNTNHQDSECDCCTANSSECRHNNTGNNSRQSRNHSISHHSIISHNNGETDSIMSSAVGSRDTRWSTSTHTRDAASVLCRPRRQNSGRSWQSCGSSKCSVCSLAAEEEEEEDAKEPKETEQEEKPSEQEPQAPIAAKEEEEEPATRSDTIHEGSDEEQDGDEPTTQIAAFLARQGAPRSRPQLPHRQKSFNKSTSYSMEDAIQEAIAAQTLEDFHNDEGWADLPAVEFPQMAIPAPTGPGTPQRREPVGDSLVSLMNPFQQKGRNRSPLQSAADGISIKSASSAGSELSRLSQLFA